MKTLINQRTSASLTHGAPSEHGKLPPHLCSLARSIPPPACTSDANSKLLSLASDLTPAPRPVSCLPPRQALCQPDKCSQSCTCSAAFNCCIFAWASEPQPGMLPSPWIPMHPPRPVSSGTSFKAFPPLPQAESSPLFCSSRLHCPPITLNCSCRSLTRPSCTRQSS